MSYRSEDNHTNYFKKGKRITKLWCYKGKKIILTWCHKVRNNPMVWCHRDRQRENMCKVMSQRERESIVHHCVLSFPQWAQTGLICKRPIVIQEGPTCLPQSTETQQLGYWWPEEGSLKKKSASLWKTVPTQNHWAESLADSGVGRVISDRFRSCFSPSWHSTAQSQLERGSGWYSVSITLLMAERTRQYVICRDRYTNT